MRNLLIAILLVIFSLQGAVVAMGEDVVAAVKPDGRVAAERVVTLEQAAVDEAPEVPEVSAALEELSDYLPVDLSFPPTLYPAPSGRLPHVAFVSIVLPSTKPPPRA